MEPLGEQELVDPERNREELDHWLWGKEHWDRGENPQAAP